MLQSFRVELAAPFAFLIGDGEDFEADVNTIDDSAVVEALRRQMSRAAMRQAIAAGNLANLNTPGYKAREAVFEDALNSRLEEEGVTLRRTSDAHLAGTQASGVVTVEREGPARRDGNTVQLDTELLQMTRAAGDFAAAQTALAAKFRLVRYAISEGR